MDRFALTTAGLATVSLGGIASAGVNFTHQLDRWNGEHSFTVASSGGSVVMSMSGMSYAGSFSYFSYTLNTSSDIWGSVFWGMDLGAGTYTVTMVDSYGDGWAWGSFVGGLYVSGDASGGISYPSSLGGSASFSFTVVPAPGAMALLGLAGLASRRRRRG